MNSYWLVQMQADLDTSVNDVQAGNLAEEYGRKLLAKVGKQPRGQFSRCRRLHYRSTAAQSSEYSLQHVRAALLCVCACLVQHAHYVSSTLYTSSTVM